MSIRVSMDQCRRMTDAAMHLRAAIELTAKASDRTMSEVAKEMTEQAAYHRAVGYALMDFAIESEKNAGTLITPKPDSDIISPATSDTPNGGPK